MPQGTQSTEKSPDAKPRGFTNDGKVTNDIVNDSYGTVDPADSTGLDENEKKGETSKAERGKQPQQR